MSSPRSLLLSAVMMLLVSVSGYAQSTESPNMDGFDSNLYEGNLKDTPKRDSTVVQRKVSKDYVQWRIIHENPQYIFQPADTAMYLFQNKYKTEESRFSYNILGNLGSPRVARIHSLQESLPSFMFDAPYSYFIKDPTDFLFTDTKTPHLNIEYFSGGGTRNGDDRVRGYFAANFSKKAGIGFDMDYVYGRGRYSNQSTSLYDARFYGYYHGDVYAAHFSFNTDAIKICENGGITNDLYITNPEMMAEGKKEYDPEEIPVRMSNTWNEIKRNQFLIAQELDIRSHYESTDSIGDTVMTFNRYRELGRLANTTEFGFLKRRFIAYTTPDNYYSNDWLTNDSIDSFNNFYLKNTLSLNTNEGFSKWAVAGLRLFASYEFRSYTMADTLSRRLLTEFENRVNEYDVSIGGAISREKGDNFNIGVTAQTVLFGSHFADFDVCGDAKFSFDLFDKSAGLDANVRLQGITPGYFLNHYHSQHYWWDLDMNKEIKTGIGGRLHIDKTRTNLSFQATDLRNYAYLASVEGDIKSCQHDAGIQVLEASLMQDIVLGPLHWDNRITWQHSSNQDILPLPTLDVYSNLYFKFTYAKRLRMEIGGDASWFSEYYAPDYSPALGQFHLQDEASRILIGKYPVIDVYLNCELRGVRFFVMVSHVNSGMNINGSSGPFTAPHYPINPRMFRFGLSWMLFD